MEFFPTSQSLNPMIKSENETNSNKILTQNPNKNMIESNHKGSINASRKS